MYIKLICFSGKLFTVVNFCHGGKDHLLALRVMRLTKPSIRIADLDPCEDRRNNPVLLDQLLSLPQSFGNIFLGETFVSYISVHNDSNVNTVEVIVKADLQTGSQRINLIQLPMKDVLEPGNSIDDVMRHEVKELGTHILVCSVSYKNSAGTQNFFRKFFKFQVLKPLDVKTKFYNVEPMRLFLEAQIQNLTNSTMCVEKVSLEPSNAYSSTSLNEINGKSTFSSQKYLKPKDTRQYLYQLVSKTSEKIVGKNANSIGKLDIVWKTGLGERGRLQTSQLQRPSSGQSDIKVDVVKVPGEAIAMESFEMVCRVTNCGEIHKNLKICFENHNTLVWERVSGFQLDKLAPKSSVDVTFQLLPVTPGLLGVTGLRIIDVDLDRTHQFDYIHYVLVHESPDFSINEA